VRPTRSCGSSHTDTSRGGWCAGSPFSVKHGRVDGGSRAVFYPGQVCGEYACAMRPRTHMRMHTHMKHQITSGHAGLHSPCTPAPRAMPEQYAGWAATAAASTYAALVRDQTAGCCSCEAESGQVCSMPRGTVSGIDCHNEIAQVLRSAAQCWCWCLSASSKEGARSLCAV
jgi:hypothetical protein